jgi:clan AA aspartic protease (TIGR02281 family)
MKAGPATSPISAGATVPAVAAAPLSQMARTEVALQSSTGGGYYLPVTINQTLWVPFVLDTGASGVQIPFDVYLVMARKGSVSANDARGTVTVSMADGSTHEEPRVLIHELKVGDTIVTDVLATVGPIGTDPLLGQSFLARLGSYTIDNQRHVLTLG